jgi:hypothetical protein
LGNNCTWLESASDKSCNKLLVLVESVWATLVAKKKKRKLQVKSTFFMVEKLASVIYEKKAMKE